MITEQISPEAALTRLLEGNKRFASGLRSIESIASSQKREQLARQGQKPFAIILTCSDSRVPAETVFDAGLGDLFVIRVAGNIAAPSLIASIEFAALSFGTPICMVMGHTRCGAIQGAVSGVMKNQSSLTPNLDILLREIAPAAELALSQYNLPSQGKMYDKALDDVINHAIALNVKHTMDQLLQASSHLRSLQVERSFKLIGAVYDIETGEVNVLSH